MKNNKKIWLGCKCDNYYKFLNELKNLKIYVYNISYKKSYIKLEILESDYKKIKSNLWKYKFKKIKDTGIYDFLAILKKHYIFLLTILLGLIVFFLCQNIIIDIDIIHENKEIRELVSEQLKNYGVKVISFKKKYSELNEIRHKILDEYPEYLDWIEIETHGMKYVVKIEERIIKNDDADQSECNVYAKESGIVKNIKLLKGVSAVHIGDYVKEGDLLISSQIIHNETLKNTVCAKGEIRAEKWYQVAVDIPLKYQENIYSGKVKYNFVFEHENYTKRILKSRVNLYESETIKLIDLFGYKLFLERQKEITKEDRIYQEDETINAALQKAIDNINLKLDKDEYIIDKKVLKNSNNNSTIEVVIFIVTDEIIS